MDYAKLMFAAELRRLAQEMRVSARHLHLLQLPKPHDAQSEVAAFDNRYPFSHFLQAAYRELVDAAAFVDSMEE